MLKLGIVTAEGLAHPRTWLGRRRNASFLLFEELAREGGDRAAEYDLLVDRLRMANGTWKLTATGRLRDVDDLVLSVISARHAPRARLRVLDLAASTGTTSVDFFEALNTRFDVDFVASDLYRDAYVVRRAQGPWAVVLDHSGVPLQYIIGRFVLPAQFRESPVYIVNHALKAFAVAALAPRARRILLSDGERSSLPYFQFHRVAEHEIARLPLMSYRCLWLTEHDHRFRFEVADILAPVARRADVVRALNIATLEHFDEPTVRRALTNCIAAVAAGGLLVTGRSASLKPGATRATVYERHAIGVRPLERLNGGCEMEAVACDIHVAESDAIAPSPTIDDGAGLCSATLSR